MEAHCLRDNRQSNRFNYYWYRIAEEISAADNEAKQPKRWIVWSSKMKAH